MGILVFPARSPAIQLFLAALFVLFIFTVAAKVDGLTSTTWTTCLTPAWAVEVSCLVVLCATSAFASILNPDFEQEVSVSCYVTASHVVDSFDCGSLPSWL